MKILLGILACLGFVAVVGGLCFLTACNFLKPSDRRPRYKGPVVKPLWTADIETSEAPIIRNGVAYVMGTDQGASAPSLFALEANSGKRLWSAAIAPKQILAITPERVFVKSSDEVVHALDPKTGKDNGPMKVTDGWTPDACAGALLYGWDNQFRLSAVTGDGVVKWQAPVQLRKRVVGPLVDGAVLAMYGNGGGGAVYVYDRETGKLLWHREAKPNLGFSSLLLSQGIAYVTEEGESKTTSVTTKNADGSTTYSMTPGKDEHTVRALDAMTGAEKWSRPLNGSPAGGPRWIEGHDLYIEESQAGVPLFYRVVNAQTGSSMAEVKLQTKSKGTPVLGDGLLFVSDGKEHGYLDEGGNTSPDSWLTAVDAKSEVELWRSEMREYTAFTPPALGAGVVVVGARAFVWNGKAYGGHSGVFAFRASRSGQ